MGFVTTLLPLIFLVYLLALTLICYVRFVLKEEIIIFENKSWFYRLSLSCDSIDIHCIIDQRLEKKYRNLNMVYRRESYAEMFVDSPTSRVPKPVSQQLKDELSKFELLYKYKKMKGQMRRQKMKELLVKSAGLNETIICRWLMANTGDNGVSNSHIERALDIALDNTDRNTARAIAWVITNTFYQTFNAYLQNACEVYPALECECGQNHEEPTGFCSRYKVVVVSFNIQAVSSNVPVWRPPRKYKGFVIKKIYYNDDDINSEGHLLSSMMRQETTESYELKCDISPSIAERLFKQHSNLTLICPSVLKSKSFMKNHDVKNEICIQLFCKTKGLIPLGETHFPKTVQGIPTDVIQGRAHLISKLRIGDKVGTQSSIGTLGGFVKHFDFDCFITCAHVMYDLQILLSAAANYKSSPGSNACIHTAQGQIDCGNFIYKTFDHDDPNKTSIDAALVVLMGNSVIDPNDYILDETGNPFPYSRIGLSSMYLNDGCLDHEEFCVQNQTAGVVAAGGMTKLEKDVSIPNQREVEVVFQSTGQMSGIVNGNILYPLLLYSPAHMQLSSGQLTHQRVFCMYNQIVLNNLDLKSGDSGTCIYDVNSPLNKTGCLGMAIAFCGGVTVVTPMKDILKRINHP